MVTVVELLGLLLVSVLWGCTNPLLKRGTEGIENIQHNNNNNRVSQILAEVKFLFLNLKYLVPFLLNQSGSLVYYYTLSTTVSVLPLDDGGHTPSLEKQTGVRAWEQSNVLLWTGAESGGFDESIDTSYPVGKCCLMTRCCCRRPQQYIWYSCLFLQIGGMLIAIYKLSLAVPVANSLTFLCTLLTGKLLGEEFGGKQAVAGMFLTMAGITLCVISSIDGKDAEKQNMTQTAAN